MKLECFKSRFLEEFSLTLRPDLSGSGDFEVTAAPEETAAREESQTLSEIIRAKPGQTQSELLEASGLPHGKGRAILAQLDGQFWRSERGSHNAKRFFPLADPTRIEIEV